jgi:hypothetical protein
MKSIKIGTLTILSSAILLSACGGGGDSSSTTPVSTMGSLKVSLTDAPACGFDSVNVTVNKIRVNQSATATDTDAGWTDITLNPSQKINLTSLTNGVLQGLGQASLPAGHYNQIRLVLTPNSAQGLENSVVPTGAQEVALTVPSGSQSGFKVNGNFDVAENTLADIVLDFDACRSVFKTGNGKYMLKPVITAAPVVTSGSISGTLDASLLTNHPVVTAEENGKVIRSTVPDANGNFKLSPLPQSNYSVVITADAHTSEIIQAVPVTSQKDTSINDNGTAIKLDDSATHKVSGSVQPSTTLATISASQNISANESFEMAYTNTDETGAYSLVLPVNAPALVNYSSLSTKTPQTTIAGIFNLTPVVSGTPGTSVNVDVSTQDVTQNFTLQ